MLNILDKLLQKQEFQPDLTQPIQIVEPTVITSIWHIFTEPLKAFEAKAARGSAGAKKVLTLGQPTEVTVSHAKDEGDTRGGLNQ